MDPISQSSETPAVPAIKHQTLIGELLLCFQLLNDVLGHHLAASKLSELSSLGYEQLRLTLERIYTEEINRLSENFANASKDAKAEAVENLEARLKELARAGILKGEKQNENVADGNQNTTEASIPQISSPKHNVRSYSAYEPFIDTPVTKSSKDTVIIFDRRIPTPSTPDGSQFKQGKTPGFSEIPTEEPSTTFFSDFDVEEGIAAEAMRLAEEQEVRQYESDGSDFKGIDLYHDSHISHGMDPEQEGSLVVEDLLSKWTTLSPSIY